MFPFESQVTSVGRLNVPIDPFGCGSLGLPAGVVKARAAAFEEFLEIIDGFRRATKLFLGHALGIEFDDHARTLVDHPDVIVFVDAHGVSERGSIVMRSPLLDEISDFRRIQTTSLPFRP